jgi:hypothetical protein
MAGPETLLRNIWSIMIYHKGHEELIGAQHLNQELTGIDN